MEFIRLNFNELLVKLYYVIGIVLFVSAYIESLVGTYDISNYFFGFLLVNILAIYVACYSLYFIIKHRNEVKHSIKNLTTSRKLSLIYSLMYLLISYMQIEDVRIQALVMEAIFVYFVLFFTVFSAHQKRIRKHFNKNILWMER